MKLYGILSLTVIAFMFALSGKAAVMTSDPSHLLTCGDLGSAVNQYGIEPNVFKCGAPSFTTMTADEQTIHYLPGVRKDAYEIVYCQNQDVIFYSFINHKNYLMRNLNNCNGCGKEEVWGIPKSPDLDPYLSHLTLNLGLYNCGENIYCYYNKLSIDVDGQAYKTTCDNPVYYSEPDHL